MKALWLKILCLLILFLQPVAAKEDQRPKPYQSLEWMGPDLTDQWSEQLSIPDHELSQTVQAVLAPGFFHEWFEGYMDPVRDWLSSHSIDHSTVLSRSHMPSAVNAEMIAKEISSAQKKVLLIAHSRGGVEVLEALIRFPELQSKVFGVIFIQSPFYGTWVADLFSPASKGVEHIDSWDKFLLHTRLLPAALKEKLYGVWQATKSLTAERRQEWMRQNESKIRELLDNSPAITMTSHDPRFFSFRVFEIFRKLMQIRGIDSDGVVPQRSMQIPSVGRINLPRSDHAFFVFRNLKNRAQQFKICDQALSILSRFKR